MKLMMPRLPSAVGADSPQRAGYARIVGSAGRSDGAPRTSEILMVRSGVRPITVANIAFQAVAAGVFTTVAIELAPARSAILLGVGAIVLALMAVFLLVMASVRDLVAEISERGVVLWKTLDPDLRVWRWDEIERVDAVGEYEPRMGLRLATTFHLRLVPGERTDALLASRPWAFGRGSSGRADPASFQVTLWHRPAPSAVRRFLLLVAPEQSSALETRRIKAEKPYRYGGSV